MTPEELDYIRLIALRLKVYPGSVNNVTDELIKLWEMGRKHGVNDGLEEAKEMFKKLKP